MKFLEEVGYSGSRHFDAHAYRTEDYEGVKGFRAWLHAHLPDVEGKGLLQFNADPEIQAILAEINTEDPALTALFGKYSPEKADAIKALPFDRKANRRARWV